MLYNLHRSITSKLFHIHNELQVAIVYASPLALDSLRIVTIEAKTSIELLIISVAGRAKPFLPSSRNS